MPRDGSGAAPESAQVAVSDGADGRRILALAGRLDAATLPAVWDAVRRAVADAPARPVVVDAAAVEYCDGAGVALFVDLLRHPREGKVEVDQPQARVRDAAEAVRPRGARARPRPGGAARAGDRGDRARGVARSGATSRSQVSFIGETTSALAYAAPAPGLGALEGRLAHLRARRRRRAADRRADLLPAGHDPRVPVGGADEALRRRDLRRRPDRPVDAARARAADDRDPARRPLGRRVRRRDRHDARQPGGRRADDDGTRPGPLPGDAAHHRRGADDAAADAILQTWSAWSAARSRCRPSRSRSRRSSRRSTAPSR